MTASLRLVIKENHHESLEGKTGVAVKESLTITHGPEERTKELQVKEISYQRALTAYHVTVKVLDSALVQR